MKTENLKATDCIVDLRYKLEAAQIPFEPEAEPSGWTRICVPQIDGWQYSIICHPHSYGFPDSLEIGWKTKRGNIDVEGWMSADDVLSFIQKKGIRKCQPDR